MNQRREDKSNKGNCQTTNETNNNLKERTNNRDDSNKNSHKNTALHSQTRLFGYHFLNKSIAAYDERVLRYFVHHKNTAPRLILAPAYPPAEKRSL